MTLLKMLKNSQNWIVWPNLCCVRIYAAHMNDLDTVLAYTYVRVYIVWVGSAGVLASSLGRPVKKSAC